MYRKNTRKALSAVVVIFSVLLLWGMATVAGATTHNASGTYTWTSGVVTLNWTSSDFTCDGPILADTETHSGVTITTTTMTWPNDSMAWTRPSATAGDIVGTWTSTDSSTGNSWTVTFDTDGTVSVTGVIIQCGGGGGQNPSAMSQHWSSGYYVQLQYDDSPKTATAVSVTGTGITGTKALTYNAGNGSWNSWTLPSTQVFFGTTDPAGLPYTYTFTITDATGTRTATSAVSCFQMPFVTNISPTGSVTGTPIFSWTGIGDAGATYGVELNDNTGNHIWDSYHISGTSIVYNGPPLTPGMTYNYNVNVQSSSVCSNGTSFAQSSFTYSGGGGTISFSGALKVYSDDTPVGGATVSQVGNNTISTATLTDGTFALPGLPSGTQFSVKMTGNTGTYAPTYTPVLQSTANMTSFRPFNLFTPTELTTAGVLSGNGMITGRVINSANTTAGYISGATVTYTSSLGHTDYVVKYVDAYGNIATGTGTYANGKFLIPNVVEGDTVTVSAAQPNYTSFQSPQFVTHGGAVSEGIVRGTAVNGRVPIDGYIMDTAATPSGIKGVTVEHVGATAPPNKTVSNGDGAFYLSVPATTQLQLKFSKPQQSTPAMAPTYSPADLSFGTAQSIGNFSLFPLSKLTTAGPFSTGGWGLTGNKGIILGRVLDGSGTSIAGATVTATSANHPETSYTVCYDNDCTDGLTTTPANGGYIVKNVDDGDTVTVTAQKSVWQFSTRTTPTHGNSVHQVKVTGTTASYPVSGTISYSGSQAGSFKLMLWSADITGSYYQELTPASGSFTFNNVPNGRYFLSAYRDSNNNSQYTIGEAYGYYQDTGGPKVAVVNGASANIGAVTLADPSGTTGASVSINANIGGIRGYLVFFRSGDSLKNNNNPVFTLDLDLFAGLNTYSVTQMRRNYEGMPVPAGTYDFYFLTGDLENGPVKGVIQYMQPGVVISKDFVTNIPTSGSIPFNVGGTVSGTVTSSYSAHPLAGVMVYLSADQAGQISRAWGRTDANGQFQFEHVPAGTHYLILGYTGYNVFTPVTITVTEGGTLAVPGGSTVITPTQAPGTISGNLTPFGSGVDSRILLKQGDTVIANVAPATNGAYSISDVVPGSYTLVGSARGYTPSQVSVTVTTGQTLIQNFTLNSTKEAIVNGLNWLLAHQRTDGSFDDNLSGNADQYVFGWTGYTGLSLLAIAENPKYNVSTNPDYLGATLLGQIHDALYGITGATPKNGVKQYFESTYHATDDPITGWNDIGAFYNSTVSWSSVAATPVALEKLIALGMPLNDPKVTGAVQFLLGAQVTEARASNQIFAGGWRYNPGNMDTDNWETAWVIMALMKAGVNPTVQAVVDGVAHIRRSQITEGGGAGLFAYQPNDTSGYGPLGTSAASILALNFAGAPNTDSNVELFFQWVKNNGGFNGYDRWADAYWWSMFPWAAILYDDPATVTPGPVKKYYETLELAWNMADDIILQQNSTDGSWSNPNYISGGSNSGNKVMYTASALMAIAPYAGLTPRPEEVAISGTVTRHDTGVLAGARMEALLGGNLSATATTDGSGAYTLSVPKNYTYTVRVVPPQTYPGYARKSIEVTVGAAAVGSQNITYTAGDTDSAPPTLTSPSPTNNVGAPYNAPISVIASDNDGINPATIIFKLDNVTVGAVYTVADGRIIHYTLSAVSNVMHTVQVDAKDYAQNPATTLTWTFTPLLRGDINGDDVMNLADAVIAIQAVSGLTPTIRANYPASGTDINGDGKVGLDEVLYILQRIAGLRNAL